MFLLVSRPCFSNTFKAEERSCYEKEEDTYYFVDLLKRYVSCRGQRASLLFSLADSICLITTQRGLVLMGNKILGSPLETQGCRSVVFIDSAT